MREVILAIDEGTTNAKAICVDKGGRIVASGASPLLTHHPEPAWSEQNPFDILDAVRNAIEQALSDPSLMVKAIGISNQRESVMIWERATGKPLSPVVVWQCRRSEAFCEELARSEYAAFVQEKTGLPIDPLFPAAKIRWLLQHLEDGFARAEAGEICAGTVDAWLVWNFTGQKEFVTDESNASRTQLLNIHAAQWDEALCEIFGVPMLCLPKVLPSSYSRGETSGFEGLPDGIPILSQIGDSHAALYGQGGFDLGVVKATYGTGSSLMSPVTDISATDYRLAKTIAWNDGERTYALEGNITHTGAAVQFMSKMLGLADVNALNTLAQSTNTNNGVYFVPALSGLGAPYWSSKSRGIVTGLTDSATSAHLARASLESIAYQVADVFFLMEDMLGQKLERLLVDGGPTRNDWLMSFQSCVIGAKVSRGEIAEVSALGAAYLAGKALGWWSDRATLAALPRNTTDITNVGAENDPLSDYVGWKTAIRQALLVDE